MQGSASSTLSQPTFAPSIIEKERIGELSFPHTDVLADAQQRRRRMFDIERACMLGNGHHGKVLIYFQTADGHPYRVDTTIWACDSEYITLKAGGTLPVRAITQIEFI